MQQKIASSSRGWGRQLIATATLLILPVAAIAWLSPGLATAAGSPGIDGLLAFDSPSTMVVLANQQAEEVAVAKDWAYTANARSDLAHQQNAEKKSVPKEDKKDLKACQKDQKTTFKDTGTASPATCL
jgi:hypothetical protein